MKKVLDPIGIQVLIAFIVVVAIAQIKSDKTRIANWAAERNYEVLKLEQTFFDYGPFWYCDDDQTIYKTVMKDEFEKERTIYFRIGSFRFQALEKNK